MNKAANATLSRSALAQLRNMVTGRVIAPGDAEYEDTRRVWNGMIDRRPGAIALCESTVDVKAAIMVARQDAVDIAVRGGGHNVAGYAACDGGIVIDLQRMNSVAVDPEQGTVTVGGGARLGDLDAAAQAHGLIVPAGVVSDTGVAGLTLAGGLGWLRNKFGLTSDSLIGVEMVTADGRVVSADDERDPELLWGLRGAGGNFGVVTRMVFRAHPLDHPVWFNLTWHSDQDVPGAVRYFRDYSETAPDEVSSLAMYARVPPTPDFPPETHGQGAMVFAAVFSGDPQDGEAVTRPLRDYGEPLADMSATMQFVDVQRVFDEDYPAGMRYYWKSVNLPALSQEAIAVLAEHAPLQPSSLSTVDLWPLGGAVGRVAEEATAFAGRTSTWVVNVEANWEAPEDDASNMSWARGLSEALQPFAHDAQYLNFPGFLEGGPDALRRSFGSKYSRLARLKAVWDPDNVFHMNQNIRPET